MTNTGKWADVYALTGERLPYGDTATYLLALEWLKPCSTVADFGCGYGHFGSLRSGVTGYDASREPTTDTVRWNMVDDGPPPTFYDGGLIRHVLEHEPQWQRFLQNAATVIRDRLCVILFTPMSTTGKTEVMAIDPRGIVDQSFAFPDIMAELGKARFRVVDRTLLRTATQYGEETVLLCDRRVAA